MGMRIIFNARSLGSVGGPLCGGGLGALFLYDHGCSLRDEIGSAQAFALIGEVSTARCLIFRGAEVRG